MYLVNLIKFSSIRFFLNILTKRVKFKNDYLYTYYTSLLFQLIILPILNILYFFNKVSYNYIIITSINYFVTDLPEIFYSKLFKYFTHHIISIGILLGSFYIPQNLKNNVLINLLLLELGSSVISTDILFNINYYKPFIFGTSRILSLINAFYMIYHTKNYKLKIILFILTLSLMLNNFKIFKKLILKMK